nr:hypothetical protein [uncultured bacterium]
MKILKVLIILVVCLSFTNCSNEDDSAQLRSQIYQLRYVEDPSLLGKVIISENPDNSINILMELNGTSSEVHPTFIYYNNLAQGGPVAITLDPCGCKVSNTRVTKLDNGTKISFDELINFNGHLKVHRSEIHMETILLQGEIGKNARNIY